MVQQQQKLTCIVTIHGIGFQQPPDDAKAIRGYADDLHDALKGVLPELGDDPERVNGGAVYVESDPTGANSRALGLSRLDDGRPLVANRREPAQIAHVALVYCNSEDWRRLHIGSAVDGLVRSLITCGRYLSIATSPRWLMRIIGGLRPGPKVPIAGLQRRGDLNTTPSAGTSGLGAVFLGLINDACTYIFENDMRSRIRGFVWEALMKLADRDDIEAIVVNAHSQGTVIAFDAVAGLDSEASDKVRLLITAGSPLRKYVDLFAWGNRIYRAAPSIPWLNEWVNFWDDADPVADPLRPGPKWKAGASVPVPDGAPALYGSVNPDGGDARDVPVQDVQVENTKKSRPGGLRAHNYWDNHEQFVARIPELLTQAKVIGASSRGDRVAVSASVASQSTIVNSSKGGQEMNNNNKQPVRIPGGAYDTGDDLSQPVVQLLTDIHVLASEGDFKQAGSFQAALTGPPESVAIIEAGATAASKVGSVAIGALGGTPAIVAVIQGIWGHESDPVRIAFVGGGALVLAAIAIAIGIIISADVQGRAAGSAAEYHARAQVASTFLNLSRRPQPEQPGASAVSIAGDLHGLKGRLKGSSDAFKSVTQVGVRPGDTGPVVKIGDQWVPSDNVELMRVEA